MEELQYDQASALVVRALEHPNNCKADIAEIYRIKGEVDAING
jgi:hypothetical protein